MLDEPIDVGNGVPHKAADPFSNPPELSHVTGNVKILEDWYSTTYLRRLTEITNLLSSQISEELRFQFEEERRSLIVPVEVESGEMAQLKKMPASNGGSEEIEKIEKQIHEIEVELERSFTMDSVPLSRLLQLRTTQTDLKSYLRGLKFYDGK